MRNEQEKRDFRVTTRSHAPLSTTMISPAEFDDEISIPKLPSINAQFFTPRFLEKPQDPIMDTIKLNALDAGYNNHLPKELSYLLNQNTKSLPLNGSIWLKAIQSRHVRMFCLSEIENCLLKLSIQSSQIHSWDSLRSNAPISASSGGFLSEQDDVVFAAAHHQCVFNPNEFVGLIASTQDHSNIA